MASREYQNTLMPSCQGCTDPYSIPLHNSDSWGPIESTGPTLIPDKIKEVCEPKEEVRICISCGSTNIDVDGFCLDCASVKTVPTAPIVQLHRLIPQFRAMSIFSQYCDPDCYSDFDLNYLFELGQSCLRACDYECNYDYVLLLFVAHKLELSYVQEAETAGRMATVADSKLPKRPASMFNQGGSGELYNSEYQLTVWGLQLLRYQYSSSQVTMFAI